MRPTYCAGSASPRHSAARNETRRGLGLVLFALLVTAAGCGGDAEPAGEVAVGGPPEEMNFAPELEIDLSQMQQASSGLYTRDVTVGSGETATPGNAVAVHYTGWLPDGTQFDSSVGGDPFVFDLGAQQVIQGWDEGVAGMREGGVRQLVIPSELAYGPSGAGGVIPPNATLVFRVELLDVL